MGLFIFNKSLVSNRSAKDGETDIDLFATPVGNLANVTSTEGLVTLYFKDGNSYTALTGGTTNIRGYEYAQVELTTNVGNEQFVVKELGKLLAQIQKGERTTIIIDAPEQNYNILGVTGINAIKRFNDLTTLATDSSTGTSESAERIELEVRFDETVAKGDPLYITGYNVGQSRITVAKADASDSAKMPSIGLADNAYSTNGNGKALTMGSLVDVDTSSFSAGDVLYVAATGGLTATKPTGSNLIQNVGKVGRSNLNNGEIVVMAIGRSNDVPNLSTGKFFIGSATNTAESAYTLPTSDGTANQVLQTNGSGAVSFSSITQATGNELENIVEDTTPQLGGNLDLNSNNITGTGNIDTTGTLSLTNTTTGDSLTIVTTEDTSTAAPVICLKRNSASPDDGDYLGQLKFKGENDADQEVVYAKITAKVLDATDTTEDGLIEFALRKAGVNNIGVRLTSSKLRLINGTGLEVGGYDFPTADGSANQVLATDGAGTLSFVTRATEAYVDTAANTLTENTQTGTSYTTVLADAGKMITCNNASAITVTIPPNSSIAYEAGTVLSFIQKGAGQVTLSAGVGVTLNNANGLKTASQYSVISCWKEDTDTWIVYGDTTT